VSTPAAPEALQPKAFVLAAFIGVLAAVGGSLFLELVHSGEGWIFHDLPQSFGWSEVPLWWFVAMLAVGTGIVLLAQLLPGHTGKSPLTGFHFETPLSYAPAILLAALGSLLFGFVLGPEAPLIILGTTIGGLVVRRADPKVRMLAGLLGGVAAIGAVFGNPFVTAFMILEFAAMGLMPSVVLLPALVALGSGYLVQIGIGDWIGFGVHSLSVPGLPVYTSLQWGDLLASAVVALAAAAVAVFAREAGERFEGLGKGRPWLMPILGFAVISVVLLIAVLACGVPAQMILFSGQGSSMTALVGETALGAVIAIVALKSVAYAVSLGGGFRGGPIFPATYLGVGVGVIAVLAIDGLSISAMVAAGIAATATVMTRLPFTSGLLAMLLVASAGVQIAPFAIVGAVIGFAARQLLDRVDAKRATGLAPLPSLQQTPHP
jgi:H+/Cl- antiporter ClcA